MSLLSTPKSVGRLLKDREQAEAKLDRRLFTGTMADGGPLAALERLRLQAPKNYGDYLWGLRMARSAERRPQCARDSRIELANRLEEGLKTNTLLPPGMQIRELQTLAIERFAQWLRRRGGNSTTMKLPVGSGKTITAAIITRASGLQTVFLVPRRALLKQTVAEFQRVMPGVRIGAFDGKTKEFSPDQQVTVVMYQSLRSFLECTTEHRYRCELVFADEVHMALQDLTLSRVKRVPGPKYRVGLSATHEYNQGKSAYHHFGRPIVEASLRQGIEIGNNPPMRAVILKTNISFQRESSNREYSESELRQLNHAARNAATIQVILHPAVAGKSTLVTCLNITHANDLLGMLKTADPSVRAAAVHTDMPDRAQEQILDDFDQGRTLVLFAVDKINVGYDCKRAEVLVNSRPTLSIVLGEQRLGRIARLYAAKALALGIDIVDGTAEQIATSGKVLCTHVLEGTAIAPAKDSESLRREARSREIDTLASLEIPGMEVIVEPTQVMEVTRKVSTPEQIAAMELGPLHEVTVASVRKALDDGGFRSTLSLPSLTLIELARTRVPWRGGQVPILTLIDALGLNLRQERGSLVTQVGTAEAAKLALVALFGDEKNPEMVVKLLRSNPSQAYTLLHDSQTETTLQDRFVLLSLASCPVALVPFYDHDLSDTYYRITLPIVFDALCALYPEHMQQLGDPPYSAEQLELAERLLEIPKPALVSTETAGHRFWNSEEGMAAINSVIGVLPVHVDEFRLLEFQGPKGPVAGEVILAFLHTDRRPKNLIFNVADGDVLLRWRMERFGRGASTMKIRDRTRYLGQRALVAGEIDSQLNEISRLAGVLGVPPADLLNFQDLVIGVVPSQRVETDNSYLFGRLSPAFILSLVGKSSNARLESLRQAFDEGKQNEPRHNTLTQDDQTRAAMARVIYSAQNGIRQDRAKPADRVALLAAVQDLLTPEQKEVVWSALFTPSTLYLNVGVEVFACRSVKPSGRWAGSGVLGVRGRRSDGTIFGVALMDQGSVTGILPLFAADIPRGADEIRLFGRAIAEVVGGVGPRNVNELSHVAPFSMEPNSPLRALGDALQTYYADRMRAHGEFLQKLYDKRTPSPVQNPDSVSGPNLVPDAASRCTPDTELAPRGPYFSPTGDLILWAAAPEGVPNLSAHWDPNCRELVRTTTPLSIVTVTDVAASKAMACRCCQTPKATWAEANMRKANEKTMNKRIPNDPMKLVKRAGVP